MRYNVSIVIVCSAVFWFGDLNYRLDEIDIDECKDKIKRRKLDDLWRKNDQVAKLLSLIHI